MKNFTDWLKEDAAANAAGTGGVAGIGVGEKGEPGVKLKRKKLADGIDPSEVDNLSETVYVWVCRKCKRIWGPADDKKVSKKCPRCGSTDADFRDDSELLDESRSVRVGIPVKCTVCGRVKKPIGRFGGLNSSHCDGDCPGYRKQPYPGSLWPNETEDDFGYSVGDDGTKRIVKEGAEWPADKEWKRGAPLPKDACPECEGRGVFLGRKCRECGGTGTLKEDADFAVDMMGKTCTKCKKGTYKETSQHDDMDGVLHCTKCGHQVVRHIKENTEFAGAPVFDVDMDTLMKSRFGKNRYHRYSKYVGEDETGEAIRKTGRETAKDIVLKDKGTGTMMYLRRKEQKS
jgi:hypothetical protein